MAESIEMQDTNIYDAAINDFVRGSIKEKSVSIWFNQEDSDVLVSKNFSKLYQLLGQYLIFGMDDDTFMCWLDIEFGIKDTIAKNTACKCVKRWCVTNL